MSQYADGFAAYQNGDYALAFSEWSGALAASGDADAQHGLGTLYEQGLGVTQNLVQAFAWYTRAAEQNHSYAQGKVGRMHVEGKGVAQNNAEAVRWFKLAGREGDSPVQATLGVMNRQQLGITHSGEAREWYRRMADEEMPDAQFVVGLFYSLGEGVPKDQFEAVRWFEKAAANGHVNAQYYLGLHSASGQGMPRSPIQACAWWTIAHTGGKTEAGQRLVEMAKTLSESELAQAAGLAERLAEKIAIDTR